MVSATDELSRVFLEHYEALRIVIQRLIDLALCHALEIRNGWTRVR